MRDAFTDEDVLPAFPVRCIALQEALAEKTRAALCRLEPAIRDFFDLDFARLKSRLDFDDNGLIDLIRRKISVPGNGPVDLSAARRAELEKQVEAQLRPVLRSRDFDLFDLDRIWTPLVALAERLRKT